ncbi:L,D-transpeptidase-like protein [Mobilisporobacter senegalensis]|uniref:L,D-transpeptidase-like protein n=1 Tax=Mobilisporobacter senegalensis TaxID=1329262 RepID=A0A3N1XR71_9FIRM|nr:L,D-transpeptidase [Mobilisporobacter senegalensis]ROR29164.1 L,D-transpeptidase-like protein [Mobilisporobacter senegalensis]
MLFSEHNNYYDGFYDYAGNIFNHSQYTQANKYTQVNKYSITINVNRHTLILFENGKIKKYYPIAVGKPSTPTPKGIFKIINKAINPGGPFGVRWLGLSAPNGDYGIRGTNNPSSIGKSVSNGCIRMYNNDILEISNLVSVGTIVKII